MNKFEYGFLAGALLIGLIFQLFPSSNLFGMLEYSKKTIIEHNCGGYTRDGKFEWYNVTLKDNK